MTSFLTQIANQYRMAVQHFVNHGYLDYYKFLYGTPQFPYWFIIQSAFSCYVALRSIRNIRKTKLIYVQQLLLAFMMTFLPRELFALLFKKLSPIIHNPQSIIIFIGIYILMCIPQLFTIVSFFAKIIGMAQGVNIARFFTLSLRNIKGVSKQFILPISLAFSIMDQVIELFYRTVSKTEETEACTKGTIIRALIFNTIFWMSTNRNYFTQYIGLHQIHFPALFLAFALSVSNSAHPIHDRSTQQQQNYETNNNDDVVFDAVEENKRLKESLRLKDLEIDQLKAEIERLKSDLLDTQKKAKEDHDNLLNEIQHLKKD